MSKLKNLENFTSLRTGDRHFCKAVMHTCEEESTDSKGPTPGLCRKTAGKRRAGQAQGLASGAGRESAWRCWAPLAQGLTAQPTRLTHLAS